MTHLHTHTPITTVPEIHFTAAQTICQLFNHHPLFSRAKMITSTVLNSPYNVGPIKFEYIGVQPAALVDCNFSCLRQSSLVRLRSGNFIIRASDAEYEAAVVARNVPEIPQVEWGIMCEPCGGRGWLVCDFCKGQKTNVKAENKRIYRRCPSCRAVGYILCSKCKVFKCVTFPDASDGADLIL